MNENTFDEFGNPIMEQTQFEVSGETIQENEKNMPGITNSNSVTENEAMEEASHTLIRQNDNMNVANVDILVETENTQSLSEPLIRPPQADFNSKQYVKSLRKSNRVLPQVTYDRDYMLNMCCLPERIRNIALVGPTGSGKTSLMDLIVLETHDQNSLIGLNNSIIQGWKSLKFMDTFKQEAERGLSIKLNGMTFLSTDLNDKSSVLNIIDTPGHINFMDEVSVALNACDNVMICIDVVEGITSTVEQLIKQSMKRGKGIIFIFNKLDRLIIDLKLPPRAMYLKLLHLVASINQFVNYLQKRFHKSKQHGQEYIGELKYSPELNNIVFASAKLGFTFTLGEFALKHYGSQLSSSETQKQAFIDSLWDENQFIKFILTPIYKVITHTLTYDDPVTLTDNLIKWKILPRGAKIPKELQDPQPILKYVMQQFLGVEQKGLYASIEHHLKSPVIAKHDAGAAIAHVVKIMDYCSDEYCLVKIQKGQINKETTMRILLEGNDEDEKEDDTEAADREEICHVKEIVLMDGQYCTPVDTAYAGQVILMKINFNSEDQLIKCGTLYSGTSTVPKELQLTKLDYINESCLKVIIAPLQPRELPKLISILNRINKYYCGCVIKVEDSGEHVLLGSGELYLDCLLYDIREVYGSSMEVKVSSPMTIFQESCSKESFTAIPVETPDGTIQLSVGASRMDLPLVKDLTHGDLDIGALSGNKLSRVLRQEYGWDSLVARNIWSFESANVMIDDTLVDEVDKSQLQQYKDVIKTGFSWAIKEGPLCGDPMFGVQFKLLEFIKSEGNNEEDNVNINQLIPTIRKACYIALLTATPVLLEPVYEMSLITKNEYVPYVRQLITQRRGATLLNERKIVGTPFVEIRGHIPVIESIGFEIDLKIITSGQCQVQLQFINKIWKRVPGDVMDRDQVVPLLKPASHEAMARDFVMKTRRRKGIMNNNAEGEEEGPSLGRYIDPRVYAELKEAGYI